MSDRPFHPSIDDKTGAAAQDWRRGLVGLIGAGIGPSLSPALHEREAAHHRLRLHYQRIDLDAAGVGVEALPALLDAVRYMGFLGVNITYPCKQAVLPLLDALSDDARAMGAVNTVVPTDGRLVGHNTDGSGWAWGFRRDLPRADTSRVVILGCGGAGAAIAHAALRAGAGELVLVDRLPQQAQALAESLRRSSPAAAVRATANVEAALDGATGLVHATPTGMAKSPGLPLDPRLLGPALWVYEVVYFPLETALLRAARERGCATADGGGMAVGQAIGAFELFTGLRADGERMAAHFRQLCRGRESGQAVP